MPLAQPEEREKAVALSARAAEAFQRKQYEEALVFAEEAVRAAPSFGRGYMAKSLSLAQLGHPGEGLAAALAGIHADPGYALAYTAAAICYRRLGRDGEADRYFARALELGPEHPQVLYNFACYCAELGREQDCREYLAKAFARVNNETFLEEARTDPDIARYIGTEWFKDILADAKIRLRRDKS
jgi:Flp pilus assembly protein TadD